MTGSAPEEEVLLAHQSFGMGMVAAQLKRKYGLETVH